STQGSAFGFGCPTLSKPTRVRQWLGGCHPSLTTSDKCGGENHPRNHHPASRRRFQETALLPQCSVWLSAQRYRRSAEGALSSRSTLRKSRRRRNAPQTRRDEAFLEAHCDRGE